MALQYTTQHGATYLFGLASSDAPAISGLKAVEAETKFESEVYVTSKNGEGLADSLVVANGSNFKGTITVSGYITDINAYQSGAGGNFSFQGRFWVVKSVTLPRKSGELVLGQVEAESYALITS